MALVGAFSVITNLGLSFQALVTVDVPEPRADVVVASLAQFVQTPAYDDSHRHQLAAAEDVLDLHKIINEVNALYSAVELPTGLCEILRCLEKDHYGFLLYKPPIDNDLCRQADKFQVYFGSPYICSSTCHRGCSILKIIVWISFLLTNIPQYKHNAEFRLFWKPQ